MKIVNNLIIADSNKYIKTIDGLLKEVELGKTSYIKDGVKYDIVISLENVKEVYIVNIDGELYDVESTTYPELVTELIRKKYSLDDELALMANSRLEGNEEKEIEFQNWRKLCKETAKKVLNG